MPRGHKEKSEIDRLHVLNEKYKHVWTKYCIMGFSEGSYIIIMPSFLAKVQWDLTRIQRFGELIKKINMFRWNDAYWHLSLHLAFLLSTLYFDWHLAFWACNLLFWLATFFWLATHFSDRQLNFPSCNSLFLLTTDFLDLQLSLLNCNSLS